MAGLIPAANLQLLPPSVNGLDITQPRSPFLTHYPVPGGSSPSILRVRTLGLRAQVTCFL